MSFAADPQAQFPDADQQAQDDRLKKLEEDVARLAVAVNKMIPEPPTPAAAPMSGPVAPTPVPPEDKKTTSQLQRFALPVVTGARAPRVAPTIQQAGGTNR